MTLYTRRLAESITLRAIATNALLLVVVSAFAQDAEIAKAFEDMERHHLALLSVNSYSAEGTIVVTNSDEVAKALEITDNTPKIVNFHVLHKGNATKLHYDEVGLDGKVLRSETLFETEDRVVTQQSGALITATTSTKDKHPDVGIRDINPVLAEFAYLNKRTGIDGLPSFSPKALMDGGGISLRDLRKSTGGGLETVLGREQRRFVVTFQRRSDAKGSVWPTVLEVQDGVGKPLRTIKVLQSVANPKMGSIAKLVEMTTYGALRPGGKPVALAKWEFDIKKVAFDLPIDDGDLEFNPASVDKIWDGDAKVWITIPK